jgi:YggT family protein
MLALGLVLGALRAAVFGAAVVVATLAVLSTLVRSRRLNPFGPAGRLARSAADPAFRPMERRLMRAGGQPAHAPWWTLAAVVVGGLSLISLVEFVVGQVVSASYALNGGPRGIALMLVLWAFQLLRVALMVRILGSWLSQSRYSRWTGWSYRLTDWFMEPLSRVIPPLGMLDLTPLVAYFGLGLLQGVVLGALAV